MDTTTLTRTLESKEVPGLYFAGQVCGTSGYEEAAGQGVVAGINAALSLLGRAPLILDRYDSYIGVMIEDLVTQKRDEPYRLFTARSENRLAIREDNTVLRIAKYRSQLELNLDVDLYQKNFIMQEKLLQSWAQRHREHLKRPEFNPVLKLTEILKEMNLRFLPEVVRTVAIQSKYEGYIDRSQQEQDKLFKLSRKQLKWEELIESSNISFECRLRIKEVRPDTFGQLQRIEGIRPATLMYVAGTIS